MKTLSFKQIIAHNATATAEISVECMKPFFKELQSYYAEQFNCTPILMVTEWQGSKYGRIVSQRNMFREIEAWVESKDIHNEPDKSKVRLFNEICMNSHRIAVD